jgi:methylenetetrahydrofolate reductase (NADPH)
MTAVSIELGMPVWPDLDGIRRRLGALPDAVERVVLTDNHAGSARLSPLAAVALVLDAGRRCTVCASTRDRNRLALYAHVTGAVALGADEILCVGGDTVEGVPPPDLRTTALISCAREWVGAGIRVGAGCGARLNQQGGSTALTQRKVEAGADFLLLQAVWEVERARGMVRAINGLGADPVIGVPLVTTSGALAALARFAGDPPGWVSDLVASGKGIEVTRRLLDGLGGERVHIYPIGPGAWEAVGEIV